MWYIVYNKKYVDSCLTTKAKVIAIFFEFR